MTVAVVTDSASALPAGVAATQDITIVPMGLAIGGLPVVESALDTEEMIARFDEGITTSGPPPGDFAKAVERAQTGDGVVVITLAGELSGTYRAALLGAQEAGGPVEVVDSQTAAGAEALVALAAARAARAGGSLEAVTAAARQAAAEVSLVGSISTLEYLVKGGHIPAAAGWAADRLHVRPVIELRQGKVRPLRPALGDEAARERLLSHWRRSRIEGADLHVIAMHTLDASDAAHLLAAVEAEVDPVESFLSGFGTALVAHTGPSLVGLAWHWVVPPRVA
ncbi:MAG TPA: DegV family protein [Acidimicrobiales bacterium]|nr:DegV family protein [Acidimicrobiales bacterium]